MSSNLFRKFNIQKSIKELSREVDELNNKIVDFTIGGDDVWQANNTWTERFIDEGRGLVHFSDEVEAEYKRRVNVLEKYYQERQRALALLKTHVLTVQKIDKDDATATEEAKTKGEELIETLNSDFPYLGIFDTETSQSDSKNQETVKSFVRVSSNEEDIKVFPYLDGVEMNLDGIVTKFKLDKLQYRKFINGEIEKNSSGEVDIVSENEWNESGYDALAQLVEDFEKVELDPWIGDADGMVRKIRTAIEMKAQDSDVEYQAHVADMRRRVKEKIALEIKNKTEAIEALRVMSSGNMGSKVVDFFEKTNAENSLAIAQREAVDMAELTEDDWLVRWLGENHAYYQCFVKQTKDEYLRQQENIQRFYEDQLDVLVDLEDVLRAHASKQPKDGVNSEKTSMIVHGVMKRYHEVKQDNPVYEILYDAPDGENEFFQQLLKFPRRIAMVEHNDKLENNADGELYGPKGYVLQNAEYVGFEYTIVDNKFHEDNYEEVVEEVNTRKRKIYEQLEILSDFRDSTIESHEHSLEKYRERIKRFRCKEEERVRVEIGSLERRIALLSAYLE